MVYCTYCFSTIYNPHRNIRDLNHRFIQGLQTPLDVVDPKTLQESSVVQLLKPQPKSM